jgi:hypothetical protein
MRSESGRDAHRIDIEFVFESSTHGGWRCAEFPIGLSCDTLREKFRGERGDRVVKCRCGVKAVGGADGFGHKFSLHRSLRDFFV